MTYTGGMEREIKIMEKIELFSIVRYRVAIMDDDKTEVARQLGLLLERPTSDLVSILEHAIAEYATTLRAPFPDSTADPQLRDPASPTMRMLLARVTDDHVAYAAELDLARTLSNSELMGRFAVITAEFFRKLGELAAVKNDDGSPQYPGATEALEEMRLGLKESLLDINNGEPRRYQLDGNGDPILDGA